MLVDAPGHHRVVERDRSEPQEGEAVVRIVAAGMCGSDRDIYAGTRPTPFVRYPIIPGHEWSGLVEAVGPGVSMDLVGAAVVGEGFRACFSCANCRSGATNLCEAGYDETGFTQPGAFADHLVLPARLLHVLAGRRDLDTAALIEPAACAADAIARTAIRTGERAAVVGTVVAFFDLGQGAGALLLGPLVTVAGYTAPFAAGAVAATAGLLLLSIRLRRGGLELAAS